MRRWVTSWGQVRGWHDIRLPSPLSSSTGRWGEGMVVFCILRRDIRARRQQHLDGSRHHPTQLRCRWRRWSALGTDRLGHVQARPPSQRLSISIRRNLVPEDGRLGDRLRVGSAWHDGHRPWRARLTLAWWRSGTGGEAGEPAEGRWGQGQDSAGLERNARVPLPGEHHRRVQRHG